MKDKFLRRHAAGAVLDIEVGQTPWAEIMPKIYESGDELVITRFKAAKKRLKRFKTGAAVIEAAQSPQMRTFIESITEAPDKPDAGETETVTTDAPKPKRKRQGKKSEGQKVADALAAAFKKQQPDG